MTFDPTQFRIAKKVSIKGIAFCLAKVPESDRLIFGSSDFKVYEVDLSSEQPQPLEFSGDGHQSYVTGTVLAGNQMITGSYDGRLIWWDLSNRSPVRTVDAHEKWIRDLVGSPDGRLIASVADDMRCKVWEVESGRLIHSFSDHPPVTPHHFPSMLYACAFSSSGRYLATGDRVGHVVVWDVATGSKLASMEAPVMYTWDPRQRRHSIGGIRSVAFSPDETLVAVGGIGKIDNVDHLDGPARIEVFRWKDGVRIHEISDAKYKGLVEQITYSNDGTWFVCAGGDHGGF
ncbi:MAG: hypothetical protein FJ267_15735, partial [Planctomycetes bacterium]|nr:hypothetical protein [Planctomycetota bacterium]